MMSLLTWRKKSINKWANVTLRTFNIISTTKPNSLACTWNRVSASAGSIHWMRRWVSKLICGPQNNKWNRLFKKSMTKLVAPIKNCKASFLHWIRFTNSLMRKCSCMRRTWSKLAWNLTMSWKLMTDGASGDIFSALLSTMISRTFMVSAFHNLPNLRQRWLARPTHSSNLIRFC